MANLSSSLHSFNNRRIYAATNGNDQNRQLGTRNKVLRDVIQYGEMPVPNPGAVKSESRFMHPNPSDTKSRSGWGGIMMSSARVIPHNDGAGAIDKWVGVPTSRIGERVWLYENAATTRVWHGGRVCSSTQ